MSKLKPSLEVNDHEYVAPNLRVNVSIGLENEGRSVPYTPVVVALGDEERLVYTDEVGVVKNEDLHFTSVKASVRKVLRIWAENVESSITECEIPIGKQIDQYKNGGYVKYINPDLVKPLAFDHVSAGKRVWLPQGLYRIDRLLRIEKGGELSIEKGTFFLFEEGTGIICEGGLVALGSADEPIVFAAAENGGEWNNITFDRCADNVIEMSHCLIEGGRGVMSQFHSEREEYTSIGGPARSPFGFGGGIAFLHCGDVPVLDNLHITDCKAQKGGGVFAYKSGELKFTNCVVSGNTARVGGGLWSSDSETVFYASDFLGNSGVEGAEVWVMIHAESASLPQLRNCHIRNESSNFKVFARIEEHLGRDQAVRLLKHVFYENEFDSTPEIILQEVDLTPLEKEERRKQEEEKVRKAEEEKKRQEEEKKRQEEEERARAEKERQEVERRQREAAEAKARAEAERRRQEEERRKEAERRRLEEERQMEEARREREWQAAEAARQQEQKRLNRIKAEQRRRAELLRGVGLREELSKGGEDLKVLQGEHLYVPAGFYEVRRDIVVENGAEISILAGATMVFKDSSLCSSGGKLEICGQKNKYVTLKGMRDIHIGFGNSSTRIEYCHIENVRRSFNINGTASLKNLTVTESQADGIHIEGQADIRNSVLRNNKGHGISVDLRASLRISKSLVEGNGKSGIDVKNGALDAVELTVKNNAEGVTFIADSDAKSPSVKTTCFLTHCEVFGNKSTHGAGVRCTVDYNDSYQIMLSNVNIHNNVSTEGTGAGLMLDVRSLYSGCLDGISIEHSKFVNNKVINGDQRGHDVYLKCHTSSNGGRKRTYNTLGDMSVKFTNRFKSQNRENPQYHMDEYIYDWWNFNSANVEFGAGNQYFFVLFSSVVV